MEDDKQRSDADHSPEPYEATEGDKPLEAEIESRDEGLYPPDIHPTVEIGGSPEEKGALDQEYRHYRH